MTKVQIKEKEKTTSTIVDINSLIKKDNEISVPFLPKGYEKEISKYMNGGANNRYKNKTFEKLLRKTQAELKTSLVDRMKNNGYSPIVSNGYIYCKGEIPIMLIAHMDTVHKEIPKDIIYKDNFITSPQGIGGDDRCGVYAILEIIKELKCHVLFTEDEERGAKGALKFVDSKIATKLNGKIKYCIEIDRRGNNDAVFYECDNQEFVKFIESTGYFKEQFGTFTDICYIAPELDCSAVNLSSGYYKEHTKSEYIDLKELAEIIEQTKKIIKLDCDRFEWVEYKYSKFYNRSSYYYDDEDYYDMYGTYPPDREEIFYEIMWGKGDDLRFADVVATSEAEAVGKFLMEHSKLAFKDISVFMVN